MKHSIKLGVVAGIALSLLVGEFSFAAAKSQTRSQSRTCVQQGSGMQTRDRARLGGQSGTMQRDRKQLRDGSCVNK